VTAEEADRIKETSLTMYAVADEVANRIRDIAFTATATTVERALNV
jgi:hypothetical protein